MHAVPGGGEGAERGEGWVLAPSGSSDGCLLGACVEYGRVQRRIDEVGRRAEPASASCVRQCTQHAMHILQGRHPRMPPRRLKQPLYKDIHKRQ
jgi:hypothetical protein